ncbi:MAG: helix-turn-helix transcriptional regulator [Eggerthellaceae bacterium]|nr:helix-turn-helix transcriptional regulator [Eggerthellaceae bacterium]
MTKTRIQDGTELFYCPVEAAMSSTGGKYKASILYHLSQCAILRLSLVMRCISGVMSNMAARRLHEQMGEGFVQWRVFAAVSARTEYFLAAFGKTLVPVVEPLYERAGKRRAYRMMPKVTAAVKA